MPQSVWAGTLRCGLLQLPVRLVPAVRDGAVRFEQRHAGCGGHVRREPRCAHDNALLEAPDIVRTLPLSGDDYLEVPDAELARIEAMLSPFMVIERAIPLDRVDSLYTAHHYVVLPRPGGEHGYAAFSVALFEEQRACVTQVVLRHRDCPALLSPYSGGLLLSTLRASEDVAAVEALADVAAGLPAATGDDIGLARQLVRSLPSGLDYQEIHDSYRERLLALLGETGERSPAPAYIIDVGALFAEANAS